MIDKETAKKILQIALSIDKDLGELGSIISDIKDPSEKKKYIEAYGNILGGITRYFVFPIVDQYPELDPDK